MQNVYRAVKVILFLIVTAALMAFLTLLFRPPVRDNDFGLGWDQYLQEPKDSIDVMFYGSSHMYCSFIPTEAYKDEGFTSYVLAGPTQSMSVTYYYFLESLRTQKPKVAVVELSGLIFDPFTDKYEVYRLQNISYMPFSVNKIRAAIANAHSEEWFSIVFDLYSYHDRWKLLDNVHFSGAYEKITGSVPVSALKGYQLLTRRHPEYKTDSTKKTIGHIKEQVKFLKMIEEECEQRGIELVLYAGPSVELNMMDAANEAALKAVPGTALIDGRKIYTESGISPTEDMHDLYHTNLFGAEKVTRYVCDFLSRYNLPDHRGNAAYAAWDDALQSYEALRSESIGEAEKKGYK